jgi:hypothetical protein
MRTFLYPLLFYFLLASAADRDIHRIRTGAETHIIPEGPLHTSVTSGKNTNVIRYV